MPYNYGHCHACGGSIQERSTDQTAREGDKWIVIRSVPTGVCTKCGEHIFRWQVAERLEQIVKQRHTANPAERIEVPVFAY